jgi:hypothetical protein
MARIRTLKPEFWTDEKLALYPPLTRLVFLGLISQADDAGRLVDNVKLLDGLLFPYTDDTCADALADLASTGRILRYRSDSGQALIQIVNWTKHQNVQKPSKYTLPAPPQVGECDFSGDSPESSRRVPVSDLGPTTPDLRPTTADPRESEPDAEPEPDTAAAAAGEVDRYRGRVDLEAYADEHGYGPRDRMIAIGEDITAWRTPTGEVVPQDERLRLLKLADAHAAEPGSKAHDRRSALRYVIAQQFDPFTIQAAAERAPRPGPQQAVTAPKPTVSADEKRARKDQELAAYAGWRERTQARLAGEPEGVRAALEQEARGAIGELGLKAICNPTTRERTIEAKVLELYGARIGTPAPAVAA